MKNRMSMVIAVITTAFVLTGCTSMNMWIFDNTDEDHGTKLAGSLSRFTHRADPFPVMHVRSEDDIEGAEVKETIRGGKGAKIWVYFGEADKPSPRGGRKVVKTPDIPATDPDAPDQEDFRAGGANDVKGYVLGWEDSFEDEIWHALEGRGRPPCFIISFKDDGFSHRLVRHVTHRFLGHLHNGMTFEEAREEVLDDEILDLDRAEIGGRIDIWINDDCLRRRWSDVFGSE